MSEGSSVCQSVSVCQTNFYTGRPFIWSSPRIRDTNSCFPAFVSGDITITDLGLSRLWINLPHVC